MISFETARITRMHSDLIWFDNVLHSFIQKGKYPVSSVLPNFFLLESILMA